MCGAKLRDKQSIVSLHSKTNLKDIIPIIKLKKLQWFGHLKRISQQVKVTFEGLVDGKRKQGRPGRRWRDDMLEWCGQKGKQLFTRYAILKYFLQKHSRPSGARTHPKRSPIQEVSGPMILNLCARARTLSRLAR